MLDRKAIPRLDDYVKLWQNKYKIVAEGHYHAAGEGPSDEDLSVAQKNSNKNQIIVSNGFIPLVFLNGRVLQYKSDFELDLKEYLNFDSNYDDTKIKYSFTNIIIPPEELTRISNRSSISTGNDFLTSFLSGFSVYYKINIKDIYSVKKQIKNDLPKLIDDYKILIYKCPYNFEYINNLIKSFDSLLNWANDKKINRYNKSIKILSEDEYKHELLRMKNLKSTYTVGSLEQQFIDASINYLEDIWKSQQMKIDMLKNNSAEENEIF